MADTVGILGIGWLSQVLLPFILVFVLFFAILKKSKILGEGSNQINSIISLAMALLIVGVGVARDMINDLVPVVAVIAVIIFVFMLLVGFTAGKEGALIREGGLNRPLQITIGILVAIVLIVTILSSSGKIPQLEGFFKNPETAPFFKSIIFVVVIAAIVIILFINTKDEKKD